MAMMGLTCPRKLTRVAMTGGMRSETGESNSRSRLGRAREHKEAKCS
jgi:hypothetical protein